MIVQSGNISSFLNLLTPYKIILLFVASATNNLYQRSYNKKN